MSETCIQASNFSITIIRQVVHEEFGIVEGLMTTVHATTGLLHICHLKPLLSFSLSDKPLLYMFQVPLLTSIVFLFVQQHKRL
jgi:hypothetical protein